MKTKKKKERKMKTTKKQEGCARTSHSMLVDVFYFVLSTTWAIRFSKSIFDGNVVSVSIS